MHLESIKLNLIFYLINGFLMIQFFYFNNSTSVNANTLRALNFKSKLTNYEYIDSSTMDDDQFKKRSDSIDYESKFEPNGLNDEEDPFNETRQFEELKNKKDKEIEISQQILLVLCFGFIILIFAITKIIMNMGQSIDNRKYISIENTF